MTSLFYIQLVHTDIKFRHIIYKIMCIKKEILPEHYKQYETKNLYCNKS